MKIGHIDLGERPIFLAPMEDVTDPAFRLMCKKFGADMVYTEFVSADALIRSVSKTEQKLNISDEERPVAIQIYGKDTETMVEAARIVEEARPDILDINFGCPVKRVAGKGAGAGMLQNIPKMLEITRGRCRKDTGYRKNPPGLGCEQQDYRGAGRAITGLWHCRTHHTRPYPCTNVYR